MKLIVSDLELRLFPTTSDNVWLVENLSDLSVETFISAPDML